MHIPDGFLDTKTWVTLTAVSGTAMAWGVTSKDNPFAGGKILIQVDSALDFAMGTDTYDPDGGESEETDVLSFGVGVHGGYFVVKGLEIGPVFRYSYNRFTDEDDNVTSSGEYLGALQIGYFLATPVPVHPWITVEGGYAGMFAMNDPDEGNSTENQAGGYAVRPSIGLAFFFTDKFAITPGAYYQYTALAGTDDSSGKDVDYDLTTSRYGFEIGVAGIF